MFEKGCTKHLNCQQADTCAHAESLWLVQAHPALQIAVKVLFGAIAITGVYQSQLYAFWLQYLGATIAAVLVGAYGFSRSSLSSSGQSFC